MKKIQNLGKILSKSDQRKIVGGYDGGKTRECNCYKDDPGTGTDKTCGCDDSISTCCGSGYTHMNCGSCS